MKPEVGKRIKLLSKMVNPNSSFIPEEDLEVGSIGTIKRIHSTGRPESHVIEVNWDNGRRLSIIPYLDKFEILDDSQETTNAQKA